MGQARISSHNMAIPTQEDCLEALENVVGSAQARRSWQDACLAAGVFVAPAGDLPLGELERVVEHLARTPGLAAVVGCSLAIRVKTAKLLLTLSTGSRP